VNVNAFPSQVVDRVSDYETAFEQLRDGDFRSFSCAFAAVTPNWFAIYTDLSALLAGANPNPELWSGLASV